MVSLDLFSSYFRLTSPLILGNLQLGAPFPSCSDYIDLQLFAEHKARMIFFSKMAVLTNFPLLTSVLIQILWERHRSIRKENSECLTKPYFEKFDGITL
jgi:hypothetical protein